MNDAILARTVATLPPSLSKRDLISPWAQEVLGLDRVDSFLEGPCVAPDGTIFVADLAHGRIFALDAHWRFSTYVEYDGAPNGMALHRDGTLYVADYRMGLIAIGPDRVPRSLVSGYRAEPFRGLSDLVIDRSGAVYFSDQGQSDLRHQVGRVFRWHPKHGLTLLMDGIPSPNGMALTPEEDLLYVAVTRSNCVYRIPLRPDGGIGKVGVYLHLSGGSGGPDGLAIDADGGLAVAHYGLGRVWLFDALGQQTGYILAPSGLGTTNVAFGGPGSATLYITEASTSSILIADSGPVGHRLFSHADDDARRT